jgi:hypothetical protein
MTSVERYVTPSDLVDRYRNFLGGGELETSTLAMLAASHSAILVHI